MLISLHIIEQAKEEERKQAELQAFMTAKEEERKQLDEVARKQMERERIAEEKIQRQKAELTGSRGATNGGTPGGAWRPASQPSASGIRSEPSTNAYRPGRSFAAAPPPSSTGSVSRDDGPQPYRPGRGFAGTAPLPETGKYVSKRDSESKEPESKPTTGGKWTPSFKRK